MLDPRLVQAINTGRCLALVGSGPSNELGYPSWATLAEDTYKRLCSLDRVQDHASYRKFLKDQKFPELFRQAEIDAGGRAAVVALIKPLLVPAPDRRGHIYDNLVKWPFACYLTTNYDNELSERLTANGEYYQVLQNRLEDFFAIRDNSSHLIIKLHSDLEHPDNVVLTSEDYERFSTRDSGKYFRDRLRGIFDMFDICIIGHSLSDFDLSLVLRTAKETASPAHPIFMISSSVTHAEEREYLERYNIIIVPYENQDGSHNGLRRLLSLADRFIIPREKRLDIVPPPVDQEEAKEAAALLIYRRLQEFQGQNVATPMEYLGPLVLQTLMQVQAPGVTLDVLLTRRPLSHAASTDSIKDAVRRSLSELKGHGLIQDNNGLLSLTTTGVERVQEVSMVRSSQEDQAYGQFVLTLRSGYPQLNSKDEAKAAAILKDTIVSVLRARGLSIANAVLAESSVGHEDLTDIFRSLSTTAAALPDGDLRSAFIVAAHQFIVEPTSMQKQYLGSISQGYFLYHMVGQDPLATRIRRNLFKETAWLCDSSVLLPLVAVGCHNHDAASALFGRLRTLGASTFTTDRLLQETWEHLMWAINFVRTESVESNTFLAAATVKGHYKQNLFLDGFIRLSAEGRVSTFRDYLDLICPSGCSRESLDTELARQRIDIISLQKMTGFEANDWYKVTQIHEAVRSAREQRGTFRADSQVAAEAEILQIIRGLRSEQYKYPDQEVPLDRTYFLSQSRILDLTARQSRVLDGVSSQEGITTWTPEALYRYGSSLPGEVADPNILQQCMLQEYYYAGVSFIDTARYVKFFGSAINLARLSFSEQKNRYLRETEQANDTSIDEAFNKTPDLEKVFFVSQMAFRTSEAAERRSQIAFQRAIDAENRVRRLEAEKQAAWRGRAQRQQQQEEARQRNLQDPRRIRKRRRQAKKRAKGK